MRLFLTSFQKAGTHQIMPALGMAADIVDRGGNDLRNVPRRYGMSRTVDSDVIEENCKQLRDFSCGRGADGTKLFGHLSFRPEYYEAVCSKPTKIIVNIRDPRDVVVSNYYNIQRLHFGKHPGHGHLNFFDHKANKVLMDTEDPISALIEIDAARWKHWLGWLNPEFENVMVVKYRELRNDGEATIKKIADFIAPHPLHISRALRKMRPDMTVPRVRRCITGEHKELFEPHHMELANELMGDTIEKLGYEL